MFHASLSIPPRKFFFSTSAFEIKSFHLPIFFFIYRYSSSCLQRHLDIAHWTQTSSTDSLLIAFNLSPRRFVEFQHIAENASLTPNIIIVPTTWNENEFIQKNFTRKLKPCHDWPLIGSKFMRWNKKKIKHWIWQHRKMNGLRMG